MTVLVCHLLSLKPLRTRSTSQTLGAGQARNSVHSSGTWGARYPRWSLYKTETGSTAVGTVCFLLSAVEQHTLDLTHVSTLGITDKTYPFTFLSLSSFGSDNSIKTPVTLQKQNNAFTHDLSRQLCYKDAPLEPLGRLVLLSPEYQGPQKVQDHPKKKSQANISNTINTDTISHIMGHTVPVLLFFRADLIDQGSQRPPVAGDKHRMSTGKGST